MKTQNRFSIGQMAKLCNVTTKQLRHYDENNILSPLYRDQDTGYRYYDRKQVEEILLIKELRQIGLPLAKIAALLHSRDLIPLRDELEKSMLNARQLLNEAQQKYDQTMQLLLRVVKAIGMLNIPPQLQPEEQDIQLVDFPARPVVATRYPNLFNADVSFIERRAELYSIVEQYGLSTFGPNMAIFHGDYMKQFCTLEDSVHGDLETCFTVADAKAECPYIRTLGGFQAVSAVFVGHYRYMQPFYESAEEWAAGQGYALSGIAIEEYLVGATLTSLEENYVTRIYLPLAGSQV